MQLTTKENIKALLKITDTSNDAILQSIALFVSKRCELEMGRNVEKKDYVEYFDVRSLQKVFLLTAYPIVWITGAYNDYSRAFAAGSAVDASNYTALGDEGELIFSDFDLVEGPKVLKVAYNGGMASTQQALEAAYPEIEMAARLQAAFVYEKRMKLDISSESMSGGSTSVQQPLELLPDVKTILQSFAGKVMAIDVKKIEADFRKLEANVQAGFKNGLRTLGQTFLRRFTKERLSGKPGTARRSGNLARSFSYNVIDIPGKSIGLIVWTANKYAATQEFGEPNRRPKGKYLAFPSPSSPIKTAAGNARMTARSFMATKGAFIGHKKETPDKPFIAKVEGGKLVVYFLLRRRVSIPPRLKMRQTFRDQARQFPAMADKAINKELSKSFKAV